MKSAKSMLVIASAWLATATGTVQAAFLCPGTCDYAGGVVSSTAIHALPYTADSSISDVTGAPVYDPLEGIVLSVDAATVPTTASVLTVQMAAPVIDTLWVVSDDDETAAGFVADERFELFVSNDGISWEDLGTFYNDNAAIDVSSYVASSGAVNYVRTQALGVDIICQINPGTCTTPVFDNAMEVLAISGISEAAVVPVPAAAWLFGSGLVGLIAFARRR